jgi:hypothetical protein
MNSKIPIIHIRANQVSDKLHITTTRNKKEAVEEMLFVFGNIEKIARDMDAEYTSVSNMRELLRIVLKIESNTKIVSIGLRKFVRDRIDENKKALID